MLSTKLIRAEVSDSSRTVSQLKKTADGYITNRRKDFDLKCPLKLYDEAQTIFAQDLNN